MESGRDRVEGEGDPSAFECEVTRLTGTRGKAARNEEMKTWPARRRGGSSSLALQSLGGFNAQGGKAFPAGGKVLAALVSILPSEAPAMLR